MSTFWSIWISVIVLGSIFGLCWLLHATRKSQPNTTETTETTGHAYDGIQEYDNPMPRWWLYLFWGTIVYSLIYLVLYPGLGTFQGLLGWSSANQYEREVEVANNTYGPIYAELAAKPIEALATDPHAIKMGQRLFATECSVCHGSAATGSLGFPDLTDGDWLYGGDPATITATITAGRKALMPARGVAGNLTDAEITQVAAYTRSLAGESVDPKAAEAGQALFFGKGGCLACHGQDGKGMQALGAPNLTDKVWLYGGSQQQVEFTIRNGRNGEMPAFGETLSPEKIHLLAAYVYSLSNKQ